MTAPTTVAGRVCKRCARPLTRPAHITDKKWAKRVFCSNACRAPGMTKRPRKDLEPPTTRVPERVWRPFAACLGRDTSTFYPDKAGSTAADGAKAICDTCPVRSECLESALERKEGYGIWGGLTPEERKKLLAARSRLKWKRRTS